MWNASPKIALVYVYRKMTRQAKRLLPKDEWNKNWLGEEMRPYNSLR
jgi:hypothetical protein